jgi:hypothetical protein
MEWWAKDYPPYEHFGGEALKILLCSPLKRGDEAVMNPMNAFYGIHLT